MGVRLAFQLRKKQAMDEHKDVTEDAPDTQKNGSAQSEEDAAVDAVAFLRLSNSVERTGKKVDNLETKVDLVSASVEGLKIRLDTNEAVDAGQDGLIAELDKKTDWKAVFLKAAGGVAAFLAATSNPEFRGAIKTVWDMVAKLFVVGLFVGTASMATGCATQRDASFRLLVQTVSATKEVALSACEEVTKAALECNKIASVPDKFQECNREQAVKIDLCKMSAEAKFATVEETVKTAKTVNDGFALACSFAPMLPEKIRKLAETICQ
jgi:hypothetical protein